MTKARLFIVAAALLLGGGLLALRPLPPPQDFHSWFRAEQADLAWLETLPPVYSRLAPGNRNPEPESCQPRLWPTLTRIDNQLHPGAVYEMRSAPQADGSGHQATYDANGNLLRQGLAAGSADRASPGNGWNPLRLFAHLRRDVIPFILAAQLDGNPVRPTLFYLDLDSPIQNIGAHLRAYSQVRPTMLPKPELAPGVCAI